MKVQNSYHTNLGELRAVRKINIGEEITVNYHILNIGMKRLNKRKEILQNTWGFNCR